MKIFKWIYSQNKENDIILNLECAWKHPTNDWQAIKSLLQLSQKDLNLSKEQAWHWSLYQGYYLVCNPEYYTHLMIVTANNQAGMTSSQPQLVISPASAVESKVERFLQAAH